MASDVVAPGATVERCPCCGSDPSRPELYLDNGFGFTLSEVDGVEASLVPVNSDPAADFTAFYREQVRFLVELRREVAADEWARWDSAIRAAFAHAMEQAAQKFGSSLTAAEITKQMLEADILARIVLDRLGPSAPIEAWIAELGHMLAEGMSPVETALVKDIIERLVRSLARSRHELGRDVGDLLRTSRLRSWGRWSVVQAPIPRRTSDRAPRARRRVHRPRSRSPGRPSRRSADDPPEHEHLASAEAVS